MKRELETTYISAGIFALIIVGIGVALMLKFVRIGMPFDIILKESEEWIQENMPFREELFEINGFYNKAVGRSNIKRGSQTYIKLENDQLVYLTEKANMESNIQHLKNFSDFCEDNNMQFMYVNFPSKPSSDNELNDLGYETYVNSNADQLLDGLQEKKVRTLDIRNSIKEWGVDFYSLFYKTDHHWNADAGLFAAQEIINELNKEFECDFDSSLLQSDNFDRQVFERCWLGETGRVMTQTYAGLDDFILLKPKYDTSLKYDVEESNKHLEGDFSILLDQKMYNNPNNDIYKTSWYYSYLFLNYGKATIRNNNMKDKQKILIIKDSFALVVAPYMALTAEEVTLWDMRYNENSVKEYILNNDFDIVIVAYTQTSLEKEKMFSF